MDKSIVALYYNQLLQEISYEDAKFKIRLEILKEYFQREFEELLKNQNEELVEPLVFLPRIFGLERMFISYYNRLLVESWHFEHEQLIDFIKVFKDDSSIPFIEQAIKSNFEYMDCDINDCEGTTFFSFIRKCMWGLAEINTQEALDLLRVFSDSENPVIRQNAKNQLKWALEGDENMRLMP